MERAISRADLDSVFISTHSSPDPEHICEALNARQTLVFDAAHKSHEDSPGDSLSLDPDAKNIDRGDTKKSDEMEEELVEFRLFASTSRDRRDSDATIRKIRLRSPSPSEINAAGSFTSRRPLSFYLLDGSTSEQIRRFGDVAVSGQRVRERATLPWPGTSYPWRVIHVPSSGLSRRARLMSKSLPVDLESPPVDTERSQRRRLGKKARIKRRKANQDAARVALENQVLTAAREMADRDKRTQRNRDKKLKRRQRERDKKIQGVTISSDQTQPPSVIGPDAPQPAK